MASGTWTSVATSGAWNTTSNWSGAVVASGSGFTANFTSNITATTTIDTTTGANWSGTIGSIVFSDNGATGSAWTLGSQATITLAGGTPTITTTTDATINGVLAGTAGLVKAGANALSLISGSSTYSGGTTINAGTVRVGAGTTGAVTSGPLGTGTVTMTGGQLSSNSTTGYTLANAFSLNASGGSVTLSDSVNTGVLTLTGNMNVASATSVTFTSNNNVVDLQGSLTGSGALTHTAGQWWLNKATGNTYSGVVTINGGIFYLGRDTTLPNQFGGGATLSTIDITTGSLFFGGTSAYQVDNTITSPVNANSVLYGRTRNAATGLTFTGLSGFQGSVRVYATSLDGSIASQTVTMTVFPTGAANLRYQQSNTVNMTQTLKYTGTANVSSSAPIVMTAGTNTLDAVWHHAPSNGTATMAISGLVSSSTAQTHSFDIRNDSSGLLTLSGGIDQQSSGVMSLKKSGTGPATISGAGTYTGSVTVSTGTLNANSATALGTASSTASISVTGGATLSLGAALNYSSSGRSTSIGGYGVGFSGALIHAFAGTANIGTISCGSTTYIRATQTGTLSSGVVTSGVSDVFVGVDSSKTLTLSGGISGTGRLVVGYSVSDAGTVYLSTSNSYAGVTSLQYGTLLLGNNNALGTSGGLTFDGNATIDAATSVAVPLTYMTVGANITFGGTADLTLYGDFDLNAASRTITTNGTVGLFTLFGTISGASRKLVKAGGNRLKLSPTNGNTYTGGTDITAGTLQAAHVTALGTTGTVTLTASGATLQTLTTGGQNGKLTVASLNNAAGGTIKIGG